MTLFSFFLWNEHYCTACGFVPVNTIKKLPWLFFFFKVGFLEVVWRKWCIKTQIASFCQHSSRLTNRLHYPECSAQNTSGTCLSMAATAKKIAGVSEDSSSSDDEVLRRCQEAVWETRSDTKKGKGVPVMLVARGEVDREKTPVGIRH